MRQEHLIASGQVAVLNGNLCWINLHVGGQVQTNLKQPIDQWLNEMNADGWVFEHSFQTRPIEFSILLTRPIP